MNLSPAIQTRHILNSLQIHLRNILNISRLFNERFFFSLPQTAEIILTFSICSLDNCVSKLIERMLSIVSPKNSTRIASPHAELDFPPPASAVTFPLTNGE
jgi:hypothetical protein